MGTELGQRFRELLRRRVPQIAGVYLAAGWGLLEFTDWAVKSFDLSSQLPVLVVGVVLVFFPVVLLVAWQYGARRRAGVVERSDGAPRAVPAARSVAVLPFANMSASPEMEYLSDGLSEEIINSLARIEGLRVASRTSAFAYKGKPANVRDIGEELNVGAVLEGSVQKAGDRLRITTQLVNAGDGYHLWSERFDREMEDVFAIEDEIASSVARALRVILPEKEARSRRLPRPDVRAYDHYLRGRQFFHQTRKKSLEYARQMFRRAIEIDPTYALAWSGVADSCSFLAMFYPISPTATEDLEEADRASEKALELAPDLPAAHASRGFALFVMKRFPEAEKELQKAMRLDPTQFEARYFYGRACFQQGRLEEAADLFAQAAQVREDYQASFFCAQALEALGREMEARLQYRQALKVAARHMDLNPDDPRAATMRAVSLCRLGRLEEGLEWAERALEIDSEDAGVRYNVACLYALEGEADKAIDCLEVAIAAGFAHRDWIEQDPDLHPLRDHPRFQQLLSGM